MPLPEDRILITGGSGSLAKQLVYDLIRLGIRPIVQVRDGSNTAFVDQCGLEKRVADLRQDTDLGPLVRGVDVLIHTAAWVNMRKDRLTQFTAINTFGAVNLFRAARKAGVRRFVHVSTVAAIGAVSRRDKGTECGPAAFVSEKTEFNLDELNIPYIMTKHAAEVELASLSAGGSPELVIVCPSIIVAPSRTGDDRGKAGKTFSRWFMPDLPNRVNLVDIRDVSRGVLAACDKGRHGERYILAGDNISIQDLVLNASSILGKVPHLIRIPRPLLDFLATASVLVARLRRRGKISFYPDIVRMLDYDWAYTSMKARTELGYTNRSIYATLRDLLNNEMTGTYQKPAR